MFGDYHPTLGHVLACLVLAVIVALMPAAWLKNWQPWLIGLLVLLTIAIGFLLVYSKVVDNISNLRRSAAGLLEQVRDVDDHRLRTVGIHFPEWRIKPLDEKGNVVYLLEDTTITRDFLIKIMLHRETDSIQIAPVRSFPQRGGQQLLATEFHRLAQRRGWAEEWRGNSTSKWKIGWSRERVLSLYGCDEVVALPDLRTVTFPPVKKDLEVE